MKHLNGDLLCAIDVETTGLDPDKHEMWEIAVVPLDSQLRPRQDILPFHAMIRTGRCYLNEEKVLVGEFDPAAIRMNKEPFMLALREGLDGDEVIDHFERWFDALRLAHGKRIVPLGQNYAFDKSFIIKWMGPKHYEHFFHYHYRDTMHVALFLNDVAFMNGEPAPLPKVSLKYLCSQLKIKNECAHRAITDAATEAEVYKRLINLAR